MGFDLTARKKGGGEFRFGAFSWPVMLEACGYLFPYYSKGAQWFHAPEVDPLVTQGDPYGYRLLGSNDGFKVSAKDAKLMARCCRNYAALNSEERQAQGTAPESIRPDFVRRIAEFAEWAEQSGGFVVW